MLRRVSVQWEHRNEKRVSELAQLKGELRGVALAARDGLEDRDRRSAAICARIVGLPQFAAAPAIHCYLPMRSEVDTRPLIAAALAAGKRVAIPITPRSGPLTHSWITTLEPAAFVPGVFGTLRPHTMVLAEPGAWALTVVPLLAFDRDCTRLGYGKGYYDQLLATLEAPAVGAAFAAQERPTLPCEPHDIPLTMIVTEDEVIACSAV